VTHDELMDGWERAWSGRDPGAFAPLVAKDFHYEDPLTTDPLESAAAVAAHAARLWAAFPDARLHRTGERLASADGRYMAAPAKLLANHTQPLEGLAATGRFLIVHVVFYCETVDGRLHRMRAFFDLYDAALQLGVLPRPGTLSEKALLALRGFGIRAGGRERFDR
jgi:steroid delta-isomerase-like uncharacterized protein